MQWFAEAVVLLLAAVFALPSCFTTVLWDERRHSPMPLAPAAVIRDGALTASERRQLQVPVADASRDAWMRGLSVVTATTQAIVLDLDGETDVERVRELATAPNAAAWLDVHVALDGAVTAKLGIGARSFAARLRAVDAACAAATIAPVTVVVYHDRRDDTPIVTRILLTPFAVLLDVVFLPLSVLGFFSL